MCMSFQVSDITQYLNQTAGGHPLVSQVTGWSSDAAPESRQPLPPPAKMPQQPQKTPPQNTAPLMPSCMCNYEHIHMWVGGWVCEYP